MPLTGSVFVFIWIYMRRSKQLHRACAGFTQGHLAAPFYPIPTSPRGFVLLQPGASNGAHCNLCMPRALHPSALALNVPPDSSLWQSAPKQALRTAQSALREAFVGYMLRLPLWHSHLCTGRNRLKPGAAANPPDGIQPHALVCDTFREKSPALLLQKGGQQSTFGCAGTEHHCMCPRHAAANSGLQPFSQPSCKGCGHAGSKRATWLALKPLGLKFGGGILKNRWSCFSIATHCQLINASCN